jgi:hypothetical protein
VRRDACHRCVLCTRRARSTHAAALTLKNQGGTARASSSSARSGSDDDDDDAGRAETAIAATGAEPRSPAPAIAAATATVTTRPARQQAADAKPAGPLVASYLHRQADASGKARAPDSGGAAAAAANSWVMRRAGQVWKRRWFALLPKGVFAYYDSEEVGLAGRVRAQRDGRTAHRATRCAACRQPPRRAR